MVKRLTIITICLAIATWVVAADKPYYTFPDAKRIRPGSRMLIWDNLSGSRNLTGTMINTELRGYDGRDGTPGYDGRPGAPALSCVVMGGNRSITYDQAGLNPPPALEFYYVLYEGGVDITDLAQSQVWSSTISGTNSASMEKRFTPAIPAEYASPSINAVTVFATYSTSSQLGAKRTCVAAVPIAVTKIGATGEQGLPGPSVSVTEPAVLTAMASASSNNPLVLQSTTAGQVKIDVRDSGANTRFWVDSAGIWRGAEGFPTVNGYCMQSTTAGVKSWSPCVPATITTATTFSENLTVSKQVLAVSAVPALVTATTVTGTYAINLSTATAYALTLTGNTTFTISTPPRPQESFTLILKQGGTGTRTATWPAAVSWGTIGAPVLSTVVGKKDIVSCLTADTGVTWLCQYALGY